jgi:hypothetical protein
VLNTLRHAHLPRGLFEQRHNAASTQSSADATAQASSAHVTAQVSSAGALAHAGRGHHPAVPRQGRARDGPAAERVGVALASSNVVDSHRAVDAPGYYLKWDDERNNKEHSRRCVLS